MRREHISRTRLSDLGVAAAVCAALILGAVFTPDPAAGPLDYALMAIGSLALAGHRRAPLAVLAVSTASMLGYTLHAQPGLWAAFPVLGAVHTAARVGHRLVAAAASGVFLAGFLAADLASREVVERTLLLVGWFLCAVVTGLADRNWQAYLRQTEQRALEAERTREEVALRRAGEERLRIARELHDSLTHTISIVKLQAGVAVHLARKRGEEVPSALLAIQEASGEAMRELRATLEVLRTDDSQGHGVGRIAGLADRARAAGLATRVAVMGTERPLPADVDRAAYRIVQEALTNAARHAGPAEATVELAYRPHEFTVRVTDDGRGSPERTFTPGVGLTGMRERVTALGGLLHAGPRPEGGFTVRAELPLERP
ncbi:histidine kinase [Streptomyces sannanensis]|uniref:histidine kinase n=1 Tax=Streptomyces sannanensis TaxID=285536 RepID=A0ABP6SIV4_9ACTN